MGTTSHGDPRSCRHLSPALADSGSPCGWTCFPDGARGGHRLGLLRGCHDLTSTGYRAPTQDRRAMEGPGESDRPFLGATWARSRSPAQQTALSAQLPWGRRDHSQEGLSPFTPWNLPGLGQLQDPKATGLLTLTYSWGLCPKGRPSHRQECQEAAKGRAGSRFPRTSPWFAGTPPPPSTSLHTESACFPKPP